jgi:hypothetical protein
MAEVEQRRLDTHTVCAPTTRKLVKGSGRMALGYQQICERTRHTHRCEYDVRVFEIVTLYSVVHNKHAIEATRLSQPIFVILNHSTTHNTVTNCNRLRIIMRSENWMLVRQAVGSSCTLDGYAYIIQATQTASRRCLSGCLDVR